MELVIKRILENNIEIIIEVYRQSCENERFLNAKKKGKSSAVLLYYIFLLMINHKEIIDSVIWIYNGVEFKKRSSIYQNVAYGLVSHRLLDYFCLTTNLSVFSRFDRIIIFVKAIILYYTCSIKKEGLGFWVDVVFWYSFIIVSGIKEVHSNGHYDRLTTILSQVCKANNINYVVHQHGLLAKDSCIKNKIYANCVVVFDNEEKETFKERIISNKDCRYVVEYKPKIQLRQIRDIIKIGVIDTPIKDMQKILDIILECFPSHDVLVMKHPLSNLDEKKIDRNRVHLLNDIKTDSTSILISGPSTLVYDLLVLGYKGTIVLYDPEKWYIHKRIIQKNAIVVSELAELASVLKGISI